MLKFKTVHNGDIDVDTALKLLRQDENLNLREKFKEQTVTYSDYCKVYRPGYESLEYDSRERLLYYNNILVVSLMEDLSDQEKQTLAVQVLAVLVFQAVPVLYRNTDKTWHLQFLFHRKYISYLCPNHICRSSQMPVYDIPFLFPHSFHLE